VVAQNQLPKAERSRFGGARGARERR